MLLVADLALADNLDVVANLFLGADRIVVLRLGCRVATFERANTTRQVVVSAILGVSPQTAESPVPA